MNGSRVLQVFVFGLLTLESYGTTIHVPADYSTIQAAIVASNDLDTIVVSPGTYLENIIFMGKAITVTSTAPSDPDVVAATVIRSLSSGGVQTVRFVGSETALTKLIGFTITGAHTGTGGIVNLGGGVGCNEASPTISHCVITGNTALAGGGLAYCQGLIEDCTIEANTALPPPGASGGGLHRCNGTIRNCRILGNDAPTGAGVDSCDALLENCVIAGNTSVVGGGVAGGNNIRLRSCTIVGNRADTIGGGILSAHGQIVNCIVWDNLAGGNGSTNQIDFSSTVQPTYSCIQGGGGGTGSIDSNPAFVDPGSWGQQGYIQGDYHLRPGSSCFDVGDNASVSFGTDLDDRPRIMNGTVDMGAYEFDVQAIPTLSESSLFVLMALLVAAGGVIVAKRRTN